MRIDTDDLILNTYKWTDEYSPTVQPTGDRELSTREAALAILQNIEFCEIIEDLYWHRDDIDIIFEAGLVSLLNQITFDGTSIVYKKAESHLSAWATLNTRYVHFCQECFEESCDDMFPFDECYEDIGEDEQRTHEMSGQWALIGDPHDFIELAVTLFREGNE